MMTDKATSDLDAFNDNLKNDFESLTLESNEIGE